MPRPVPNAAASILSLNVATGHWAGSSPRTRYGLSPCARFGSAPDAAHPSFQSSDAPVAPAFCAVLPSPLPALGSSPYLALSRDTSRPRRSPGPALKLEAQHTTSRRRPMQRPLRVQNRTGHSRQQRRLSVASADCQRWRPHPVRTCPLRNFFSHGRSRKGWPSRSPPESVKPSMYRRQSPAVKLIRPKGLPARMDRRALPVECRRPALPIPYSWHSFPRALSAAIPSARSNTADVNVSIRGIVSRNSSYAFTCPQCLAILELRRFHARPPFVCATVTPTTIHPSLKAFGRCHKPCLGRDLGRWPGFKPLVNVTLSPAYSVRRQPHWLGEATVLHSPPQSCPGQTRQLTRLGRPHNSIRHCSLSLRLRFVAGRSYGCLPEPIQLPDTIQTHELVV